MLVIDGQAKTIQLSADQLDYTAGFIYSRWKDWVQESDNAKFLEAFRVVGGDDLGGGSRTPAFIFVRNDYGWRIKKPESDEEFLINGNLLGHDPALDTLTEPDGDFSPTIRILQNNVTQNIVQQMTSTGTCLHLEVHDFELVPPILLEGHFIRDSYLAELVEEDFEAQLDEIFNVELIEPDYTMEALCHC